MILTQSLVLASLLLAAPQENPAAPPPYAPSVAAASGEGEMALRAIRLPPGFAATLFAAEPHVANIVAFAFDGRGRLYVVETFRLNAGVTDTREHMVWLDDDLAARRVEDRVAMYAKHIPDAARVFTAEHDRVRLVEDADGDLQADRAAVFADGFHAAADGLGAGVLPLGSEVWFTCIPHLWRLRDADGDGRAEARTAVQSGYGVHVGYSGHDLHGLAVGPDGRLYFSIGDRGLNVRTEGRSIELPDTGAVLRCELDGSGLEIFASGLRNPQELAFNELGDLFSGENNSDAGDQARWVHLVEGGDSGWHIGFQFIEAPVKRGPWNAERMWEPRWDGQPAYIVPPLANIAAGPSGLCFDPGTGLPERYRGHFFLADFRGSSATSGVWSFGLKPQGATYEVTDLHQFAWQVLATDVDIGPDGGLYISDWVHGWNVTGKGRIYRLMSRDAAQDAAAETRKLLAAGMQGRPLDELGRLLGHADLRVRREAQLELAARGEAALETLARAAREATGPARLHALWGLGHLARRARDPALRRRAMAPVADALAAADPEVRAQAAKTMGEAPATDSLSELLALLSDPNPRVRFFAAQTLGKLRDRAAAIPLLALLKRNDDHDAFIRHAAVVALAACAADSDLRAAAHAASRAVRLGALLALRRLRSPAIAGLLGDAEAGLVLEAARAIHDVPIPQALPALAALPLTAASSPHLARRVLDANFRLGGASEARELARLATDEAMAPETRVEAVAMLGDWERPSGRDRIVGLWRPLPPRDIGPAAAALRGALPHLLASPAPALRAAAVEAVAKLRLGDAGASLARVAADAAQPGDLRASALRGLESLHDPGLLGAARAATADGDAAVRIEGQRLLGTLAPLEAIPVLERAAAGGSLAEKQGALRALGTLEQPAAAAIVGKELERLEAGSIADEVRLETLESAAHHASLAPAVARLEAARAGAGPVERFRECLSGGDADRGRQVFFGKAAVECDRCHIAGGSGGQVGPNLNGVLAREGRAHILESIVAPNAKVAKGFETIAVATRDGRVLIGVVKEETAEHVALVSPDGVLLTIPSADIADRSGSPSAMPEDVTKFLTRRELRDLVAFIASLK